MAARAVRLAACLIPLLALGSGISLASPGPVDVAGGHPTTAAFCAVDWTATHRRATPSARDRVALHCYCCGRDENGHCNHQCCDN
jgi:hypothetical protein